MTAAGPARPGASPRDALQRPIAFVLFKYFPFGGLQRDFLRIAQSCAARGHAIRVYTLAWEGELPAGFEIVELPVRALANHRRYARFALHVQDHLQRHPARLVVGFNKVPGLDVYYAADPCFQAKARAQRGRWYRWTARYRYFAAAERAVFDPAAATHVLVLTERQQADFERCYGTPGRRFTLVPPPVAPERRRPVDADAVRAAFRAEFGLGAQDRVLLALGSGFATKGLDRSIRALAALPADLARTVRLFVVGADAARGFLRLARRLGVADQVAFFGGRADAQRFLLGCDLLLHPAYSESGGIVLLEAMIAGLPVIATAACGFAPYVAQADAGVVLPEPFEQRLLDRALAAALGDDAARARWQANGIAFGRRPDLYGMAERVTDLIEGWL